MRSILGLVVLVAAVYGASLRNEFVHDDTMFIRDPRIASLTTARQLFTQPRWGFDEKARRNIHLYYRPLEALPYVVSAIAFASKPWPAHLMIVALHALNVILLFLLVRSLLTDEGRQSEGEGDGDVPAAAAAAVFAVHPGTSESVFWIAAIGGVGAVSCVLAALLLHRGLPARAESTPYLRAFATGLLFLVGLLFKESAIVLPLLLLAYDLLLAEGRGIARLRRVWLTYAAMALSAGLYTALRVPALGGVLPGRELQPFSLAEQITNALAQIPRYFMLFVWPARLSFFYDFVPVAALTDPWLLAGGTLTMAAAVAFLLTVRRKPLVAFAIVMTFLGIAPHLVMRLPGATYFGERYLYLPAAALLILLARGMLRTTIPRRRLAMMTAAIVVGLASRTVVRGLDYRNEITLFSETLRPDAEMGPIRTGLVVALIRDGKSAEALPMAEDAARRFPRQGEPWHNLGLARQLTGDTSAATAAYRKAISIDPSDESSLLNLGFLLDRAGEREESVELQLRVVEMNPSSADAWWNLAAIALEEQEWANARQAAQRVIAVRGGDADARAMLRLIESKGGTPDGIDSSTAARIERARARFDSREIPRAISMLEAAAWLDADSPAPHHYLANIHYMIGKHRAALAHERQALARDPDNALYHRNVAALIAAGANR